MSQVPVCHRQHSLDPISKKKKEQINQINLDFTQRIGLYKISVTDCPDIHVDKIQGQLGDTPLGELIGVLSEQFNWGKNHPECEYHYVVWRSRLNTKEKKLTPAFISLCFTTVDLPCDQLSPAATMNWVLELWTKISSSFLMSGACHSGPENWDPCWLCGL